MPIIGVGPLKLPLWPDVGVRDHESQVGDVRQSLFLELLAGNGGDGERRVLQVLRGGTAR